MAELLKKVLMDRDNLTDAEATVAIFEARKTFQEYLDDGDESSAYNVCEEMFGLEPDYLMDLL